MTILASELVPVGMRIYIYIYVCWLACWLAGGLAGWLAYWLAGGLAGWLACWLAGWLTGLLAGWLSDWLAFCCLARRPSYTPLHPEGEESGSSMNSHASARRVPVEALHLSTGDATARGPRSPTQGSRCERRRLIVRQRAIKCPQKIYFVLHRAIE